MQTPNEPAREPIRTAVIGVGYLGRFHAQKYAQLDGSKLMAVVDRNQPAAQAVGAELGVPVYTDYREILGRVDAVSLAVPTPLHHAIGRELLESGIHVLIEKPIATTTQEAQELIDTAKKR